MAKQRKEQARPGAPPPPVPKVNGPRLPYHPQAEDKFGIDRSAWKALVEVVFPMAKTVESVILALSYCRARHLDPFKHCIHIVPIWDKDKRKMVETIWPGIGELRTTAFRTKAYAGREMTSFGPEETRTWGRDVTITFPSYAQVTVYRMVAGKKVSFAGPPVYWMETFSSTKDGFPNSMWKKRPRGQLDKCAEAAALRAAFPEEIGDMFTDAEGALIYQHGYEPSGELPENTGGNEKAKAILNSKSKKEQKEPEPEQEPEPEPDSETKAKAEEQKKKLKETEQTSQWHCLRCGRNFSELNANGQCPECLSDKVSEIKAA